MNIFFYLTIMVGFAMTLLLVLILTQTFVKKMENDRARDELALELEKVALERAKMENLRGSHEEEGEITERLT